MRRSHYQTLLRLRPSARWHDLAARMLFAHIRPGLCRPLAPPILATVEVTRSCNLQCRWCATKRTAPGTPSTARIRAFIREAAKAGVLGVGFTGGEPLLEPTLEAIAAEATAMGLVTHLNTNGTLVDGDRAETLLNAGIGSINISLDGAREKTHDAFRGKGAFERTLAGIEALVRARSLSSRDSTRTRLLAAMTLCEANADEAIELLGLARCLGLDGCTFIPLHFFDGEEGRPRSPAASQAAKALVVAAKGNPWADNSKRYLLGMTRFFSGAPMPLRCSALHTSVLVSPEGRLYPCVPSALRGRGGIDYRPGTLLPLFREGAWSRCVDAALCSRCWWNCHRELDVTLGVL